MLLRHLALAVTDEARSQAFYVSVKVRDPDGYVVEVSWEPSAASP
jgi:hypothetical protein